MSETDRSKPADELDSLPAKSVKFFNDPVKDNLAAAIEWLRGVLNGDVTAFLDFIDYLQDESSTQKNDDLEQVRYALFLETETFRLAYELYCNRAHLKDCAEPDELMQNLVNKYVTRGE